MDKPDVIIFLNRITIVLIPLRLLINNNIKMK